MDFNEIWIEMVTRPTLEIKDESEKSNVVKVRLVL